MTASLWCLTILILLIMFGAGQRILDQMRLNDKQAIIVLVSIVVGLLIPPIYIGKYFCFSIGGFLIPFIICLYMLFSCGWSRDLLRAFVGTIIVAGVVYGLQWLLPSRTETQEIIDPTFVYGIVAGITAYALGRSRRNAFICSVFGISLALLIQWIISLATHAPIVLGLGVGGAFGTIIISTLISVGLCEFLGRAFETANPDDEEKVFNYETHTYDSEKNGHLNKDGTHALATAGADGQLLTTSDSKKVETGKKSKAKAKKSSKAVRQDKKQPKKDKGGKKDEKE